MNRLGGNRNVSMANRIPGKANRIIETVCMVQLFGQSQWPWQSVKHFPGWPIHFDSGQSCGLIRFQSSRHTMRNAITAKVSFPISANR